MGGRPKVPPPPPSPPPPATPVDEGILDARKRELARQRNAGGVKSTFLTGARGAAGSPTLGTPTLLGGGKTGY
jgi:hypothetical protein